MNISSVVSTIFHTVFRDESPEKLLKYILYTVISYFIVMNTIKINLRFEC